MFSLLLELVDERLRLVVSAQGNSFEFPISGFLAALKYGEQARLVSLQCLGHTLGLSQTVADDCVIDVISFDEQVLLL
jgi:hypothetical protein